MRRTIHRTFQSDASPTVDLRMKRGRRRKRLTTKTTKMVTMTRTGYRKTGGKVHVDRGERNGMDEQQDDVGSSAKHSHPFTYEIEASNTGIWQLRGSGSQYSTPQLRTGQAL